MNQPQPETLTDSAPLGANVDGDGVSFALFSKHAERVELCLFDPDTEAETGRYDLSRDSGDTWIGHLPGLAEGALYGYRVHGPYAPQDGHRFNPNKLLLDPYARRFSRALQIDRRHFGFRQGDQQQDLSFDTSDSGPVTPKCVVTAPLESPPTQLASSVVRNSRQDTPRDCARIIYEAHVRGLTILHPELPASERGTFAGMSDSRVIEYLKALGVTSIELMPVHYLADEPALQRRGLVNYWGYNSIGFFSPNNRYSASGSPVEFARLVDRLHDAGLEVILDVVYNHTAEGDQFGPTLCFRGIDNASYYRLDPQRPREYVNDTGCGNTLDLSQPQVRDMVLDSLRYWAREMGVDGFRFDLATTLARDARGFQPQGDFLSAVQHDPVLGKVKMIAEPWDIGPDGYQLGQFPVGWSEWNDRYRDDVRRFWRGDAGTLPALARRLHGSGDLFEQRGRGPEASINFVSSHDGFTLADVVSFETRHNEANGENNADGHHHNYSANYGVEGETDDPAVCVLRRRQRRNLLATLMLSQGTPMLLSGDELGHSQSGNNNAYCQDNELSWFDWRALDGEEQAFLAFVKYLAALRGQQALLAWQDYIHDSDDPGEAVCRWYNSDGELMDEACWNNPHQAWVGMFLSAPDCASLLLLINGSEQNIHFQLPVTKTGANRWRLLLDTADEDFTGGRAVHDASSLVLLRDRSLNLFQQLS